MSQTLVTIALPSSVTFADAAKCSKAVKARLLQEVKNCEQEGGQVVIDASAVERFDSSVLAVLLQCRRDALDCHCTIAVKLMPARLEELAHLYGVAQLLPALS